MSASASATFDTSILASVGGLETIRALAAQARQVKRAFVDADAASKEGAAAHVRYAAAMGQHVKSIRGHFDSAAAGFANMRNQISAYVPAIAVLGSAGSLVGLAKITKDVADQTLAMSAAAEKLGPETAKAFGGLAFAAKQANISTETLSGALVKLELQTAKASGGRNKDLAGLYKHLGISMKDARGHIRSAADMLPELADAFQKTSDPAMRVRMAVALFGKAGADMLPMLVHGRAELEAFTAAGKKFAVPITAAQRQALIEYSRAWIELDASIGGFKKIIGAELAGAFTPIVKGMADWILANREWIAVGFASRVKALSDLFQHFDLSHIFANFGTFTAVVAGAALVMSPFIAVVGAAGSTLIGFGGAAMALSRMLLAAFVASGPIGWAIGGVMALAAAAYLIYENWEPIKKFFVEVWADPLPHIKTALLAIFPFLNFPNQIIENWTPIKEFFAWLWNMIGEKAQWALDKIKPLLDAFSGVRGFLGGVADTLHIPHGAQPAGGAPSFAPNNFGGGDGMFPLLQAPPPAGAAPGGAAPSGRVDVNVNLNNVPPGSTVNTQSGGQGVGVSTDVGYSNPMAVPF